MIWKSLFLTLLAAIIQILIFPEFGLFPLAWIMLVPLLAAIESRGPLGSFLLAGLYGLVMALGITYWLYISVVDYFGLSPIAGLAFIVGACLFYAAIYCGLFGLLVSLARPLTRGRLAILVIPCFWVTCEILRADWLSEDPWGLLGYSQYKVLPLIQMAEITGVYGISFLVVMVNVAVYQVLRHALGGEGRRSSGWTRWDWSVRVGMPCLLLACALIYGKLRMGHIESPQAAGQRFRVAAIQGNVQREYRWKSIYYGRNLAKYLKMTRKPETLDADLVVWPENAVNFHPDREPMFRRLIQRTLSETRRTLLTGAPHMDEAPDESRRFFNSAYLITGEGIQDIYSKIHLMPFSERKPAWVAQVLAAPGEAHSTFSAGEEATVFSFRDSYFSAPICFEMVYPELIRKFVRNGARFLINISNDSWFGPTAGPYQHLLFSPLRAVENRRYVVRAANTGISALVAPTGEILKQAELDEEAILLGTVIPREDTTFYTRHGDLFAVFCALVTLVSVLSSRRLRKFL